MIHITIILSKNGVTQDRQFILKLGKGRKVRRVGK